jgi:hypothetical protein
MDKVIGTHLTIIGWILIVVFSGLAAAILTQIGAVLIATLQVKSQERQQKGDQAFKERMQRDDRENQSLQLLITAHFEQRKDSLKDAVDVRDWIWENLRVLYGPENDYYGPDDPPPGITSVRDALHGLKRISYFHPTRSIRDRAKRLEESISSHFGRVNDTFDEVGSKPSEDQLWNWLKSADSLIELIHTPPSLDEVQHPGNDNATQPQSSNVILLDMTASQIQVDYNTLNSAPAKQRLRLPYQQGAGDRRTGRRRAVQPADRRAAGHLQANVDASIDHIYTKLGYPPASSSPAGSDPDDPRQCMQFDGFGAGLPRRCQTQRSDHKRQLPRPARPLFQALTWLARHNRGGSGADCPRATRASAAISSRTAAACTGSCTTRATGSLSGSGNGWFLGRRLLAYPHTVVAPIPRCSPTCAAFHSSSPSGSGMAIGRGSVPGTRVL